MPVGRGAGQGNALYRVSDGLRHLTVGLSSIDHFSNKRLADRLPASSSLPTMGCLPTAATYTLEIDG